MSMIKTDSFQPSGLMCARYAQGMEYKQLSVATGIDSLKLARFEIGTVTPSQQELDVLANELGVLPKFFNNAWIVQPDHAIVPRNQSGKLTKEQAIIVSGYTQILMCDFSDLHKDIEKRLGYPVFTHQIPRLGNVIKTAYKDDFLALCTTTPGKIFL
ncbi:helix-turn-helix transcriptional regulator [Photobacterium toruni]|uniref:Helix-turn-helix transcriptional regulator n=1 Tax=Photobacterium toruni TaxID=1935446 RepID=A0ABU6LA10_9GAMM|nr:helix-turn-helix transcriptional regulator [Photobacterium toruni]